jgi:hypothetical protein
LVRCLVVVAIIRHTATRIETAAGVARGLSVDATAVEHADAGPTAEPGIRYRRAPCTVVRAARHAPGSHDDCGEQAGAVARA